MAQVYLTDEAREDLRDLDGSARCRVIKAMKKLEVQPEQRGEPLGSQVTGDLTTFRKLVVGDREFRIIYRVEQDGRVCVVWVIGRRVDRECYALAVSRLQLYVGRPHAEHLQAALDEIWTPAPLR